MGHNGQDAEKKNCDNPHPPGSRKKLRVKYDEGKREKKKWRIDWRVRGGGKD